METSDFAEAVRPATPLRDPRSRLSMADKFAGSPLIGRGQRRNPTVFVFNPFAEAYIARGKAFTPVKHQATLAEDLANLPQFLCDAEDVVLLPKRPSEAFLDALKRAGFPVPEFVELKGGRIVPARGICQRRFGSLRPWAWGPDSVELLKPLFPRLVSEARGANDYFNDGIARLYSKAWSASFLRKVLARSGETTATTESWLCCENEAGVVVSSLENALEAVAAIRSRGHHRVVIKKAFGLAGQNAIRLWEEEVLPTQRQWLAHAIRGGQEVVVEPWLERELDFSVHMEMGTGGLQLRGYTGLENDQRGQFLANWAEADHSLCLPGKALALLGTRAALPEQLRDFYGEIFFLLEAELGVIGFVGPISIDAFVYRTASGKWRLKPVVEINPRYTMGRLTLELMKHACPGSRGRFALINRAHAGAEGFADLSSYAAWLGQRFPLRLEVERTPRIKQGALCLNDPGQARACLATFEVRQGEHG